MEEDGNAAAASLSLHERLLQLETTLLASGGPYMLGAQVPTIKGYLYPIVYCTLYIPLLYLIVPYTPPCASAPAGWWPLPR